MPKKTSIPPREHDGECLRMAEDKSSPLSDAAARIRETAKWLTVSLAALGGVLTAGTQLSSIGSLPPGSERFWIAVVGGIVTAIGAGIILMKSVETATTPAISLDALSDESEVSQDKFLLAGHGPVSKLKEDYISKINARKAAAEEFSTATTDTAREQAKIKLENANADWDFLQKVAANVLHVASYFELAKTWKKSAWYIFAGAAVASVGIVTFVWAINPPKAAVGSAATPAVVSTAEQGRISLTDAGYSALGSKLGSACADKKELAALKLGDTDAGPDVLVQEPGCTAVRLVLGSDWGSFTT